MKPTEREAAALLAALARNRGEIDAAALGRLLARLDPAHVAVQPRK